MSIANTKKFSTETAEITDLVNRLKEINGMSIEHLDRTETEASKKKYIQERTDDGEEGREKLHAIEKEKETGKDIEEKKFASEKKALRKGIRERANAEEEEKPKDIQTKKFTEKEKEIDIKLKKSAGKQNKKREYIERTKANEKNEDEKAKKDQTEDEAGCLIDVLHLHMLQLVEEQIAQQLTLEIHTSTACLILARTRLQHGSQRTAAASWLPGSSRPYRSLCRLLEHGKSFGKSQLKLIRIGVENSNRYLQPVTHIFGTLVPYSLRLASQKWERCVEHIVECTNVQRELESVVRSIERLKWAKL